MKQVSILVLGIVALSPTLADTFVVHTRRDEVGTLKLGPQGTVRVNLDGTTYSGTLDASGSLTLRHVKATTVGLRGGLLGQQGSGEQTSTGVKPPAELKGTLQRAGDRVLLNLRRADGSTLPDLMGTPQVDPKQEGNWSGERKPRTAWEQNIDRVVRENVTHVDPRSAIVHTDAAMSEFRRAERALKLCQGEDDGQLDRFRAARYRADLTARMEAKLMHDPRRLLEDPRRDATEVTDLALSALRREGRAQRGRSPSERERSLYRQRQEAFDRAFELERSVDRNAERNMKETPSLRAAAKYTDRTQGALERAERELGGSSLLSRDEKRFLEHRRRVADRAVEIEQGASQAKLSALRSNRDSAAARELSSDALLALRQAESRAGEDGPLSERATEVLKQRRELATTAARTEAEITERELREATEGDDVLAVAQLADDSAAALARTWIEGPLKTQRQAFDARVRALEQRRLQEGLQEAQAGSTQKVERVARGARRAMLRKPSPEVQRVYAEAARLNARTNTSALREAWRQGDLQATQRVIVRQVATLSELYNKRSRLPTEVSAEHGFLVRQHKGATRRGDEQFRRSVARARSSEDPVAAAKQLRDESLANLRALDKALRARGFDTLDELPPPARSERSKLLKRNEEAEGLLRQLRGNE